MLMRKAAVRGGSLGAAVATFPQRRLRTGNSGFDFESLCYDGGEGHRGARGRNDSLRVLVRPARFKRHHWTYSLGRFMISASVASPRGQPWRFPCPGRSFE